MDFGNDYQADLLLKLTSKRFVETTVEVLSPEMFHPPYRSVAEELLPRVIKARKPVSMGQLKQVCQRHDCKLNGASDSGDHEFDRQEILNFRRYQIMRDALLRAGLENQQGKFDKAVQVVEDARKKFPKIDQDEALAILDSNRPIPRKINAVPTGIGTLDELFDGGPGAGEVCSIMAPSGGGKTTFLVWLAATALKAGKRVLYVTLDDPGIMIEARFRRHFMSGQKKSAWSGLTKALRKKGGELLLREYGSREVSPTDLALDLPDIDVLVIDYADELRRPSGQFGFEYHDLGYVYADLRNIAKDRKIPIWTASQVNRSAYSADGSQQKKKGLIDMQHIDASLQKVMKADRIISLNQTETETTDEELGTATILIAKNRYGPKRRTIPVSIRWSSSEFTEGKWAE